MSQKQEIRKFYRKLRDDMSSEEVKEKSELICRRILKSSLYREADKIYVYDPLGNEADLRPVIADAWQSRKRVAFPKVFGDEMRFFEVTDFSFLHPGTFGVREPEETTAVCWQNVLVLTPGVSFDRSGHRIGYGKGYYDRYFSGRPDAFLLGAAYELQIADAVPAGEFDRKLQGLVTENGLWFTEKERT